MEVLKQGDPGGKLWSTFVWCLGPVLQHDFGRCDAWIGGGWAWEKGRLDPVGEYGSLRQPSRAWAEYKHGEYARSKQQKSTLERLRRAQLNRQQRRKLQRQLFSEDPGLAIVNPQAAGLEVSNESH